jgi:aminoglycoside phosphotransferase (APT) family kinase protein
MSCEAKPNAALIQHIIQTYLGGTAGQIVDRSPGYSGSFVYAVDVVAPAGDKPCIVRLIPDWEDDDDVANRVYGSRAASFPAAHALLQGAAVPLPQLYAALMPQPELPFYGYVMERLPGDDVQALRARVAGPSQIRLDALAGHHLGAIHRITRSFDGWADWTTPASLDWRDAFFTALRMVLDRACVHAEILQHRQQLVQMFDHFAGTWIDPSRFVLSHGDGLQGMAVQTTSGWALSGVIDIEDHRFTDQRFALAVYEVEVSMGQPSLHDSFWTEYLLQTTLDPSYSQFRPLFQVYVLLDWLGNIPRTQVDDIARLTHEIACRV